MSDEIHSSDPKRGSKLRALLQAWVPGTVAVQSWLDEQGISRQLMKKFVDSGWIKRIGVGAYSLVNDDLTWLGAIYTLQKMKHYKMHVAGATALEVLGSYQYLTFNEKRSKLLLSHPSDSHVLPTWFKDYFNESNILCVQADLFDDQWEIGLTQYKVDKFEVKVSAPERAILEIIYLAKSKADYVHALELLENLITLRPSLLQELLVNCRSHKVIRLFLAISEKINHPWLERLEVQKFNLGKGKYVLSKGGYYNTKYQISTPINLNREAEDG